MPRYAADQRRAKKIRAIKAKNRYVGSGGYGRDIGGAIGASIGSAIGVPTLGKRLGGHLGNLAAKRITKRFRGRGLYTGHGAYSANALVAGGSSAPEVPSFSVSDDTGAVTISHREFITDIYGPTTQFNVQTYVVNPGLDSSFPFLSQLAQNYEEYQFTQLMYTYRSTTQELGSSTTGQLGSIILCTDYNVTHQPFADKGLMLEYIGAQSAKTTEHCIHGVECDPMKLSGPAGKYVRVATQPPGEDLRSYDHGLFQLAIANSPTAYQNQVLGELWVSYTIELRKPKLSIGRGLNINEDVFIQTAPTDRANYMSPAATLYTGYYNNIGCTVSTATNNLVVTFPAGIGGLFKLEVNLTGGIMVTSNPRPTPTITGNMALYAMDWGSADSPASVTNTPDAGATTSYATNKYFLYVRPASNGVNNTIDIGIMLASATTMGTAQVKVTQLNPISWMQSNGSKGPPVLSSTGTVTYL